MLLEKLIVEPVLGGAQLGLGLEQAKCCLRFSCICAPLWSPRLSMFWPAMASVCLDGDGSLDSGQRPWCKSL